MANMSNEKINGQYLFEVINFCPTKRECSPAFSVGGHSWNLDIFPVDNEFLGFYLVHKSDKPIKASYSISVRCQRSGGNDHVWVDPDGIVEFMPDGDEDSRWGNEEFISFRQLMDPGEGYVVAGTMLLVIDVTVHGPDCAVSYQANNTSGYDNRLVALIQNEDSGAADLIDYVDQDIGEIMKGGISNTVNEVTKRKQNRLVSAALNTRYR